MDYTEAIHYEELIAEGTSHFKPQLTQLLQVLGVDMRKDVDERTLRKHHDTMQKCSGLWNDVEKAKAMVGSLNQEVRKPNFDEWLSLYFALEQICEA